MNRLQIRDNIRNLLNDIENSDVAHNWPDAMINSYIQEAADEIAQRTLCNKDSLTEGYCKVPLVAGTIHYPYPDNVIIVDSVRKSWDGWALTTTNHSRITASNPLWESDTREPYAYLTDFSFGVISIVGNPTTGTWLNLTVRRMPATMTTDADIPDGPERFHNYLTNWVMYRCLQKIGEGEIAEKGYSFTMAQKFLADFEGNANMSGRGGGIGKIIRQLTAFYPAERKVSFM